MPISLLTRSVKTRLGWVGYGVLWLLWLGGCSRWPSDWQLPTWQAEVTSPFVKAQPAISDLLANQTLTTTSALTMKALGLSEGDRVPFLPPLGPLSIGFNLPTLTNQFKAATFSQITLKFTITNRFPIDILAGCKLRLLNERGEDILNHTTSRNLNSKGLPYNIEIRAQNITVTNSLRVVIDELRTRARLDPYIVRDEALELELTLSNAVITTMVVESGSRFELKDTAAFALPAGGQLFTFESGRLPVGVVNALPITFRVQGYFLDSINRRIDSLFTEGTFIIEPATIDNNGNLLSKTSRETVWQLPPTRLERLKKARRFAANAVVEAIELPAGNTSGVRIDQTQPLSVNIHGEAVIRVKP